MYINEFVLFYRRANEVFDGQLRKILNQSKPITTDALTYEHMTQIVNSGVFNCHRRESLALKVRLTPREKLKAKVITYD